MRSTVSPNRSTGQGVHVRNNRSLSPQPRKTVGTNGRCKSGRPPMLKNPTRSKQTAHEPVISNQKSSNVAEGASPIVGLMRRVIVDPSPKMNTNSSKAANVSPHPLSSVGASTPKTEEKTLHVDPLTSVVVFAPLIRDKIKTENDKHVLTEAHHSTIYEDYKGDNGSLSKRIRKWCSKLYSAQSPDSKTDCSMDENEDKDVSKDHKLKTLEQNTTESAHKNEDVPSPSALTLCNPHIILLLIIIVPILLCTPLFVVNISTGKNLMSLMHLSFANKISMYSTSVISVVTKLEDEMLMASRLVSLITAAEYNNSIGTRPIRNEVNNNRIYFLSAVDSTQQAIDELLLYYGVNVISTADEVSLLTDGLDLSALEASRRGILIGESPAKMLNGYTDVIRNLVMYISTQQVTVADSSDLDAIAAVYSVGQWSAAKTLRHFLSFKEMQLKDRNEIANAIGTGSIIHDGQIFADLENFDELQSLWDVVGALDTYESYLRHSDGRDRRQINNLIQTNCRQRTHDDRRPSRVSVTSSLTDMLARQSTQILKLSQNHVSDKSVTEDLKRFKSLTDHIRVTLTLDNQSLIHSTFILQFTALCFILSISFILLVCASLNVVVYFRHRKHHRSVNATVRFLSKSRSRMKSFYERVKSLQGVASWHRLLKSSIKRGAPPEERGLYRSVLPLVELELFLPPTVKHPPFQIPKEHLSYHCGLFLRPALVQGREYVALKISISELHCVFGATGWQQKQVQHHLAKLLSILQDLGAIAAACPSFKEMSEKKLGEMSMEASSNAPFVSVYGDHAVLWMNVDSPMKFPCLRALLIAKLILYECSHRFNFARSVPVCICSGNAVVGHIGNQIPIDGFRAVRVPPMVTFATFGPLAEDMNLLTHVATLHNVSLILNNAAAKAYFTEQKEMHQEISKLYENVTDHKPDSTFDIISNRSAKDNKFVSQFSSSDAFLIESAHKSYECYLAQNRNSVISHFIHANNFLCSSSFDAEFPTNECSYDIGSLRSLQQLMYRHIKLQDTFNEDQNVPETNVESALYRVLEQFIKRRRKLQSLRQKSDYNTDFSSFSSFPISNISSNSKIVSNTAQMRSASSLHPIEFERILRHFTVHLRPIEVLDVPISSLEDTVTYLDLDMHLPNGQVFVDHRAFRKPTPVRGTVKQMGTIDTYIDEPCIVFPCYAELILSDEEEMKEIAALLVPAFVAWFSNPSVSGVERFIGDAGVLAATAERAVHNASLKIASEWRELFKRYVRLVQRWNSEEAAGLIYELQSYGLQLAKDNGASVEQYSNGELSETGVYVTQSPPRDSNAISANSSTAHFSSSADVKLGTSAVHYVPTTHPTVDRLIDQLRLGMESNTVPTTASSIRKKRLIDSL